MITRLIWTIWTPMSSVPKKADKLNLSLSLMQCSCFFSANPLILIYRCMFPFCSEIISGNPKQWVLIDTLTWIPNVSMAHAGPLLGISRVGNHQHCLLGSTILLLIFHLKFNFDSNDFVLLLNYCPIDHYEILHMWWQHCCRDMCRIL